MALLDFDIFSNSCEVTFIPYTRNILFSVIPPPPCPPDYFGQKLSDFIH